MHTAPTKSEMDTAIHNVMVAKCSELLFKHSTGNFPYMVTSIVRENSNGLWFIYFESRTQGFDSNMKRYHQYVFSDMFMTMHYFDSNVIDEDKSYSIPELKEKFKNYLTHLLNKIQ